MLLAGIMICISLLHACEKNGENCRTCIARENGEEVGRASVCSEEAESSFRFEFEDADEIDCD